MAAAALLNRASCGCELSAGYCDVILRRVWNLTGETITHVSLAPEGTTNWSADQCRNDPDGTVDFDERLRITGVATGRYDVRFTGKSGRSCIVKGVDVKAGAVFSIGKDAWDHCGQ